MKKVILAVLSVVFCIAFLSGCGMSKEKLEKQVGQNILEYMQENLSESDGYENMELISINLFEIGKGQYTGTVVLKYDQTLYGMKILSGHEESLTVSVLTDGKAFQWELE